MAFTENPLGITNVNDAQDMVARPDAAAVQRNLDFYYDEHWQDGDGWAGPIPEPTDADYGVVKEEIRNGFVSKNVIKEVVNRASNGVTGKTPLWSLAPRRKVTPEAPITPEEQTLIDEATELLTEWTDNKEFNRYLSEALRNTLMAGKSTLRLFVPLGFVTAEGIMADDQNPVKDLHIDSPSPLAATVLTDPNTRERVGLFLGKIGNDDTAEMSYLLPEANERGQRITELVVLIGTGANPEIAEVTLDLGGNLPMFEMEMPRLTTEQVISMQKEINKNLTMMGRNSVLGGFLERVILNGQLPAHYEEDEDGNRIVVRDPFETGAGSVNVIQGTPIIDENTGQVRGYAPADIRYKDPQNPNTFLIAADALYQMVLQECDQMHARLTGTAASGDGQRAAMGAFFSYLKTPKQQVDKAGKWTLETVLAYAGYLSGKAGKFSTLKVNFEARLDTGAIPTAELDILERYVRIGIVSLETARERAGIEHPDVEARRVEGETEIRKSFNLMDNKNNKSVQTGQTVENVDNNDKTGAEE